MNRNDLISAIAESTDITKKDVKEVINALEDTVVQQAAIDSPVRLKGFGTFSLQTRKARVGQNPLTGAPIEIAASKNIKFKPSSKLKELL